MRKILFPVLILGIILGMSNCSDNSGNTSQKQEPDYYPYEVTNIQYTIKEAEDNENRVGITVTWDNPTDPDFSHVKWGNGTADTKTRNANSDFFVTDKPVHPVIFCCISKQGKVSKGVTCDFK